MSEDSITVSTATRDEDGTTFNQTTLERTLGAESNGTREAVLTVGNIDNLDGRPGPET